jgi:hypothetical protein
MNKDFTDLTARSVLMPFKLSTLTQIVSKWEHIQHFATSSIVSGNVGFSFTRFSLKSKRPMVRFYYQPTLFEFSEAEMICFFKKTGH